MIPQPLPKSMPKPPRLHWGWVFALMVITRSLFGIVWLMVQANWVRKVNGSSRAFRWSIANACVLPALFVLIVIEVLIKAEDTALGVIAVLGLVVFLITNLGTVFTLRSELESGPIAIPLGAVATFLFQTTYFQYHLHDYDVDVRPVPEGTLGLSN